MKILHVNYSLEGGAGVAVRRLNKSLLAASIDSNICYFKPFNSSIANISWMSKKLNGIQNIIFQKVIKNNSLNYFPTRLLKYLNNSDADIIHLHWINAEMISIEQISKINKPIVWTFHDMWPFCGSEHYTNDLRYKLGYTKGNYNNKGIDIDRWVFRRKQRIWKNLMISIVCPSVWLSECVKKSKLFNNYQVFTIPNCLDIDIFKPLNKKIELRKKFGLPLEKNVILFGAYKPHEFRKGGDLLEAALKNLKNKEDFILAVFGCTEYNSSLSQLGMQICTLGSFSTDRQLAEIYNLADVMCVPSRQESFGQTASEPLSCGIPVVAFNTTGLKDIVDHKINGYLAEPFSTNDFTFGIEFILDDKLALKKNAHNNKTSNLSDLYQYEKLCLNARNKALNTYSEEIVAKQFINLYNKILNT